jgi:GntR family transcriptional regulator
MSQVIEPELSLEGGARIQHQIEAQIRDCIATGQLHAGEQLPTIRAMAVELAVNPAAVHAAYTALEKEGLLTSEEGSGTFVAYRVWACNLQAQHALEQICFTCLTQASRLGFSAKDVIGTIEALTRGSQS